ncbi:MAG: prolipoprotein diacylglyceryl transferase [Spirochaetaceae bacterium]|jgi:phosphatidylglycerol:prolipoprotein diacylglycerol transferase|nr:prolipoprotein diacylglyceryl transferase [Spirochaetaceae bacterium]
MPLAIPFPSWIHPEIFPGVPVLQYIRWYGLMYICAFAIAYTVFTRQMKEGILNRKGYTATADDAMSFFTWAILGLLLGARLFSVLIYDTSDMYRQKPWLIFWPFDSNMRFTGRAGMSYHGGFAGCFLGTILWCLKKKQPLFRWIDTIAVAIPLGYTCGRLGNFLNGELFGRVTTVPWGMIFPQAQKFSRSLPWVQDIIEKTGLSLPAGSALVNLPRHPSQLYEALFEGIVLFLFLWFLRKRKPFDGFLSGMYIIGYGVVRFVIEYFREPDAEIGYRITAVDAPTYFNESLLNISTGQVLCFCMIAIGLLVMLGTWLWYKKHPIDEVPALQKSTPQRRRHSK